MGWLAVVEAGRRELTVREWKKGMGRQPRSSSHLWENMAWHFLGIVCRGLCTYG
jgi:hypothetical protein